MIKSILMPVDFSPRDAAAAHYVTQLHRRFGSEVTLLHVVPPPDYEAAVLEAGGPVLEELIETRRRLAQEKLDKDCLEDLVGVPHKRLLREGFPSEQIVCAAGELGVDLIVMPTHGYGRFRRLLLGSVTSRVLNEAGCPVFTGAHMQEEKLEDIHFEKIAAAVDLSDNSSRVLDYAAGLAKDLHAPLEVLHAMPSIPSHMGMTYEHDFYSKYAAAAHERLTELTKSLPASVDVLVESGDAGRTIASLVAASHADLVVIGRSTSHGLAAMTTEAFAIIRESGKPVISV